MDSYEVLLADHHLIGDQNALIAIPSFIATPELMRRILAAYKSTRGGFAGVDYVLKNYSEEWTFEPTPPSTTDRLLAPAVKAVEDVEAWWIGVNKEPEPIGMFAAGSALQRVKSTFAIASMLARLAIVLNSVLSLA